jgi:hypothetical protein
LESGSAADSAGLISDQLNRAKSKTADERRTEALVYSCSESITIRASVMCQCVRVRDMKMTDRGVSFFGAGFLKYDIL